jgi:SPP1 gp7 family putative phage head morphogenesis protein
MPSVYELAEEHRRRLLEGEREAAVRMVDAYQDLYTAIQESLDGLYRQMAIAEADGEKVTSTWLMRRGRLESLLSQADTQMQYFAQVASRDIAEQQSFAIVSAGSDAQEQARVVGIEWNRLPVDAVREMVGFLGDGSPILRRLQESGVVGVQQVRSALVRGVALGKNPRQVAREVKKAAGLPLRSALTISRTETMRAYRESTRLSYEVNSDVVVGWRWLAALGARTCPVCVAMHGQIRPTSERFGSHPNCRCTLVPVLVGQETEAFEMGEEWLQKQSEVLQEGILGKAGAEAWRSGAVRLDDFVETRNDPDWGLVRSVRSVSEMGEPIRYDD